MEQEQILQELLEIIKNSGIEIRREPLEARGGGICTIKGRTILFLDTQASMGDSIESCITTIQKMVDIENIYLRPQIRQLIETHTHM